ncbi:MAG: GerMN domain-containing protein [Blautia sp.]|nr:GerMN domain-containing protein [Blautia sp.]MDY3999046.1 GerMN domain-containing protein [Blautia sp.]
MKKLLCLFLAVLLTCISLAGCTIEVEEEPQKEAAVQYSIYYLSSDETELIEEDYTPKEESTDYMLKDLMQRLGKKAAEGEEINLLPKEVTINSYKQQDDVLIIDFNGQYSKMTRAREILVRAGIVKTFVQVPGIKSVRFTVGGEDLKDSKNEAIGEMTADAFVEYPDDDLDSYRYGTFTLYFADKTGTKLVEEKRNVYYKRNLPRERVVLEQLAKGPMAKDHYPAIPESASALSVMIADRICYVDMDGSLLDYVPDVSEEVVLYSIVNSLLAACEADKVQISVEGKSSGNFGENLPVYSYYEKNEKLVVTEQD